MSVCYSCLRRMTLRPTLAAAGCLLLAISDHLEPQLAFTYRDAHTRNPVIRNT